jgi:hypothetical protein
VAGPQHQPGAEHPPRRAGQALRREGGSLQLETLAPRESYSPPPFGFRIPVRQVLGDTLPPGRYYFDAEIRLLDDNRIPQCRDRFTTPASKAQLRRR